MTSAVTTAMHTLASAPTITLRRLRWRDAGVVQAHHSAPAIEPIATPTARIPGDVHVNPHSSTNAAIREASDAATRVARMAVPRMSPPRW